MFKRLRTSNKRTTLVNLDNVTEIDIFKNFIVLADGGYLDLTEESMAELVDFLKKPTAEERIADALEKIAKVIDELSREPSEGEWFEKREFKIRGAISAFIRKSLITGI